MRHCLHSESQNLCCTMRGPGCAPKKDSGLQRLARLIDQRLRDAHGLVRVVAVEPVVALLLDDATPWWSGAHVKNILRDWLRAHVFASTPVGHLLRVRLRERLTVACAAADRRLEEARAAAAAAWAARTPEQIEKERQFVERNQELFTEIGYPRSRRQQHPEVPTEIKDKVVVELLALLGPDLGAEGEAILRRVGKHAASWLAPALEEALNLVGAADRGDITLSNTVLQAIARRGCRPLAASGNCWVGPTSSATAATTACISWIPI